MPLPGPRLIALGLQPIGGTNWNAPQLANTFAAVRALPVVGLVDGASVLALGRAAQNDGLQGQFRYLSTSVAADDNKDVLAPNVGAGRWLRVNPQTDSIDTPHLKAGAVTTDKQADESVTEAKLAAESATLAKVHRTLRVPMVQTIAALRAFSFANSFTGDRVHALGGVSVGDRRGGLYRVDKADAQSVDDGEAVIVAADGTRLHLVSYNSTDDAAAASFSVAHADRAKSISNARIPWDDADSFAEGWANLAAWKTPVVPGVQVNAGKLYSTGIGGGDSGANKGIGIAMGETFRAVISFQLVAGDDAGGIIIGVSEDDVDTAPAPGGANVRGILFNPHGVPQYCNRGALAPIPGAPVLVGGGTYIATICVDDNWLSIVVINTDGTQEIRYRWQRLDGGFIVKNLFVFNSDTRGLAGCFLGQISYRRAFATAKVRAGIEGYGRTGIWSGDGANWFKLIVPPSYDSRTPCPLAICFHGNGSDENMFWDTDSNAMTQAIHNAGFAVLTARYPANSSTWGNADGLAAYVAAYRWAISKIAIGPVVFVGVSMGGLESLLSLASGSIPGVQAWAGVVPVCSLYNAFYGTGGLGGGNFTALIRAAYGIAGDNSDYAAKTAGHDPMLLSPRAFLGTPMFLVAATEDYAVPYSLNGQIFADRMTPYVRDFQVRTKAGNHTGDPSPYVAELTAWLKAKCGI